jgi:hypothetical protein
MASKHRSIRNGRFLLSLAPGRGLNRLADVHTILPGEPFGVKLGLGHAPLLGGRGSRALLGRSVGTGEATDGAADAAAEAARGAVLALLGGEDGGLDGVARLGWGANGGDGLGLGGSASSGASGGAGSRASSRAGLATTGGGILADLAVVLAVERVLLAMFRECCGRQSA